MKFLDGFKTILGAVGLAISVIAPQASDTVANVGPHAVGIAQGVFGLLAVLGVIHKAEKKTKEY